MKSKSLGMLMCVLVLGVFSSASIAAPDFQLLEKARLAKKAEAQKAQAEAKKCMDDGMKIKEGDR